MAAGMTKTQLVRHLAEKVGANNKTAAAFLENLADTAIKETKKNGVFVVPGIGRLVKAHRKARPLVRKSSRSASTLASTGSLPSSVAAGWRTFT